MLLIAVALVTTTVATHLLLMHRVDIRIRNELVHENDEFRAVASSPASGSGSVSAVLRAATARGVAERTIALVGVVDGRVVASSVTAAPLNLSAGSPLVTAWAAVTHPTWADGAGPIRYLAVPFHVTGDPRPGVFVAVVFTGTERSWVWRVTRLQIGVEVVALVVAALLAWVLAGRVLRPVRQTTELARRITETDLSDRIPVRGHDEMADLATTINGMLDRLQAGITGQRAFLADAGHELRTPITIVQGNLDTLHLHDPEDIETVAIASDELQRMTRMVDDLLTLARTEQPDFLQVTPVDVAALTSALADKVRTLAARRWVITTTADGCCVMDRQRVTQAVLELAANAITYTPPHTPLELATAWVGDQLTITVADHGPGIPPDKRSRIFDRFARLDRRRTTGTGLGLSIVAAISHAHGGTVSVADRADGPGAVFTVHLPAGGPPHSDQPRALRTPPPARDIVPVDSTPSWPGS